MQGIDNMHTHGIRLETLIGEDRIEVDCKAAVLLPEFQ